MNYKETIEWLFKQLPMYQRQGKIAFKKDLSNISTLCELSNNPYKKFKSIHIAGTNGKGSVSHILSSVIQEAGYKVGLYTSPHLKDFRERIKINGKMISKKKVIHYVERFMLDFVKIKPSFFEMSVAMAFDHFAENKVDIAIIEVGLGGRLDSTNIISPIVSIITNISFDHTQFLGNTLKEIALEKAGIIKPGIPVVIGETNDITSEIFIEKAKTVKSKIYFADNDYKITDSSINDAFELSLSVKGKSKFFQNIISDISGKYQLKNIITALKSIEIISKDFNIKTKDIYTGLRSIRKNTGFSGRWQILGKQPLIIADTGHNIAGIDEIRNQIKSITYKNLHIIFGLVNDKDIDKILNLMPKIARYYFTKADIPRSLNETELQKKAKPFQLYGKTYPSVIQAFNKAKSEANKSDFILVCGSTFVVAEIL